MKQILSIVVLLFASLAMYAQSPGIVFSVKDSHSNEIYYKVSGSGNNVHVTGEVMSIIRSGSVKIPNEITYKGKRYGVIGIKSRAFENLPKITSIECGNQVDGVLVEAFKNLPNLTTVKFTNRTMDPVLVSCFVNCPKLKTVIIPSSVKMTKEQIADYKNNGINLQRN